MPVFSPYFPIPMQYLGSQVIWTSSAFEWTKHKENFKWRKKSSLNRKQLTVQNTNLARLDIMREVSQVEGASNSCKNPEKAYVCVLWAANLFNAQRMEGGEKRIFGVFEAFFDLYAPQKRRKHNSSWDIAAFLRCRKREWKKKWKWCHLRHLLCHDFALPKKRSAISNEVPKKRRFCGAYISAQKWKTDKKKFTMSLDVCPQLLDPVVQHVSLEEIQKLFRHRPLAPLDLLGVDDDWLRVPNVIKPL